MSDSGVQDCEEIHCCPLSPPPLVLRGGSWRRLIRVQREGCPGPHRNWSFCTNYLACTVTREYKKLGVGGPKGGQLTHGTLSKGGAIPAGFGDLNRNTRGWRESSRKTPPKSQETIRQVTRMTRDSGDLGFADDPGAARRQVGAGGVSSCRRTQGSLCAALRGKDITPSMESLEKRV